MNQQEVEQWIAQNGGAGRVQYSRASTQVDNPAADPLKAKQAGVKFDPAAPDKISVATEKWTAVDDKGQPTGAVLHVMRNASGDFDVIDQANPNPAKPQAGGEGPPGGKAYIDDGPEAGQSGRRWGWNPQTRAYDRDLGPSPSAQKPQGATARQDVPGHPGIAHVVSKDANGNTDDHYEDANGNRVAAPTDVKPQPQQAADGTWGYWDNSSGKPVWIPIANGPAGKKYVDVKFDEQRGQWWGFTQAGQWEQIAGGPGARTGPQKPGPAMPTFIVGMASDALRQFGDQLNAAVAAGDMTPAERDKRYAEAERAAQIAVNDAVTVQRQQESNLNARVNLATTRYTQQMDGLNNALSFVTKLNATLPEGSDLGGKAFAALLGMQAIAARRSGITDIQIPGAPDMRSPQGQQIANATANTFGTASAQLSRLTNPADPAAVHADQQAVSAALQAPEPPAATSAAVEAPAPPPAVLAPAAPAAAPPPTPGEPGGPPLQTTYPTYQPPSAAAAPPAAPPPPSVPDYGAPGMSVLPAPPTPAESPIQVPPLPAQDMVTIRNRVTGATRTIPRSEWQNTWTLGIWYEVPAEPPAAPPLPTNETTRAQPSEDFAIMKTIPSPPPAFAPSPPDVGDHPMLLMDRAQTTPPWRLDPSEIERMRAAGIPESTIFSVPGQGVAA